MQWGRRWALFITCAFGLVGVSFTLLKHFKMQLFGRLIYGVAAGLSSVVSPRFIEEYVPLELCGSCITVFAFAQNLGILIAMSIAYILPEDSDTEALEVNETWRWIFGLPIFIYAIIFLCLVFLVPYDSPKFHMQQGQRQKAIKSIHMVYNTEGHHRTAQKIYNYIKKTSAD